MYIVGNRISDILDLTTVAQFPESSFQILFLDRSNILSYVAVETVAHIRAVRNVADDAVLFAELLYLQAAQGFCRCAVDRIEDAVLFLKLGNLVVDIFQRIECELSSAVIPNDAVIGFNSGRILSDGFKWPP